MSGQPNSDALVIFGISGDLAYKKIFPALQRLVRTNRLNVPVVGVARSGWTSEQLIEHVRASLAEHGGVAPDAFPKLARLLRSVSGDYANPDTFIRLRAAMDGALRPLFYLAIPPSAFPNVVDHLAEAKCTRSGARVVVEKPFGRDLETSRALNETLRRAFPDEAIFRIDHYLGKEPVQNILYFRFANAFLVRRERADYDGRNAHRGGARSVLRGSGSDPRRDPEPSAADRQLSRDGGAVAALDGCHSLRTGKGASHGPAAVTEGNRAGAILRVSQRKGSESGIRGSDLCGASFVRRFMAVAGRSVFRPRGKMP